MSRKRTQIDSLQSLLDGTARPVYAVSARRRVIYCNLALADWLDLEPARIIGRLVEYHSETGAEAGPRDEPQPPLTELCPPPRALAGEACQGTLSCAARDGGLVHRRASFLPLSIAPSPRDDEPSHGVLVVLDERDLSSDELAAELAGDARPDDLHRVLRQFRRSEATRYAVASLLGNSAAMQRVRSQVLAAAASRANTLICGPPGSGRGHVARAVHYQAAGDDDALLVPVDGSIAGEEILRRAMELVRGTAGSMRRPATLMIENIDLLDAALQSELMRLFQSRSPNVQIVATCTPEALTNGHAKADVQSDDNGDGPQHAIEPTLAELLATITIQIPRLADRSEDLPILAQAFLESANRGSDKQVGSIRNDALDLLALQPWRNDLDQLRSAIIAAHGACRTHEITPADLPASVHHGSSAASHVRRSPEHIVLDELLAAVEKEAIVRALAAANGNKSEAAELLGMTRPRLYRRLVQLGLAGPEFIETDADDQPA